MWQMQKECWNLQLWLLYIMLEPQRIYYGYDQINLSKILLDFLLGQKI